MGEATCICTLCSEDLISPQKHVYHLRANEITEHVIRVDLSRHWYRLVHVVLMKVGKNVLDVVLAALDRSCSTTQEHDNNR